jgi:benzil reductase ((S)-benzoin forming)
MKYYFITGTGRGIGKALAENLLKNEDVKVTGISRTATIKHKNYSHIITNLSDLNDTESIFFPTLENADEIVLINNSGVISEILRVGKLKNQSIINDYHVNIVSPSILMNNFIKKYQQYENKRVILNISSGAGRHNIDAWGVYCASKSAMDMLSKNIEIEQNFYPEIKRIKVFSVAPGVVDTKMQEQIRAVSVTEFSDVEKFIQMKQNKELAGTDKTALLLLRIIDNQTKYSNVLLDIRNIEN